MGFNTSLLVMNDGLDQLAKDPLAGAKIANLVSEMSFRPERVQYTGIGNHANLVQGIACTHADDTQLLAVGQNLGRHVNGYRFAPETQDLDLMAAFLRDHGYKVSKPKGK